MQELVDATAGSAQGSSVEAAFAKINLALHVGSRRADGYHSIDTLVTFADLADVVRAGPSSGGGRRLNIDGTFSDELASVRSSGNLVLRAAEALVGEVRVRALPPTDLFLTKEIPIAAGLGGGSADAAATLRLLNRYWDLGYGDTRLAEIGAKLGADVPMCLPSRPVIAQGIGERLAFVSGLPSLPMTLVRPPVMLSTAEVYGRLQESQRSPLPPVPAQFESVAAFASWLMETRNDLTQPARGLSGLVDAAMRALSSEQDCLIARMSGSGASVFGIFATSAAAERAEKRIRNEQPDWWLAAVETIGS